LYALELPVIAQAHHHAAVGGVRELVALDRDLAARLAQNPSAAARLHVDPSQWRALRSLSDDRVLRRFAAAVEKQEAIGCLSVVHGILLVVYSLPLRQGLHNYARARIEELAGSPAWVAGMRASEVGRLATDLLRGLPRIVNRLCQGVPRSGLAALPTAPRVQSARSATGGQAGKQSAPASAPANRKSGVQDARGSVEARGAGAR
jgi:hypothetical protein